MREWCWCGELVYKCVEEKKNVVVLWRWLVEHINHRDTKDTEKKKLEGFKSVVVMAMLLVVIPIFGAGWIYSYPCLSTSSFLFRLDLNSREFVTTETLEKAMAIPAHSGWTKVPKALKNSPAAKGIMNTL